MNYWQIMSFGFGHVTPVRMVTRISVNNNALDRYGGKGQCFKSKGLPSIIIKSLFSHIKNGNCTFFKIQ